MLFRSGGALAREVPDMFNSSDDARPQQISHTVITIDPRSLGETAAYKRFDEMAEGITNTGGRVPGAKRVHPLTIDSHEFSLAAPVLSDLNNWCEKLGVPQLS